jgi:hypothetical protein
MEDLRQKEQTLRKQQECTKFTGEDRSSNNNRKTRRNNRRIQDTKRWNKIPS